MAAGATRVAAGSQGGSNVSVTEDIVPAAIVSFLAPAPALLPLVTSYYVIEVGGEPVSDVLHPEWANLRLLLAGERDWLIADRAGKMAACPRAALFGATSCARATVANAGRALGVGLTPLGWTMLVGADAAAFANAVVMAEALLGPSIAELHRALSAAKDDGARGRLLDAFWLARAAVAAAPRYQVARLTGLLADPAMGTVAEFAAAAELTPVTLGRACRRHFGFTPKLLLRRQRFLRTLATVLETRGKLSAALDHGYSDQSHFNREFRHFMGETPGRYFDRVHPILDAAASARRAALGASVQGLHVAKG